MLSALCYKIPLLEGTDCDDSPTAELITTKMISAFV